MTTAIPRDADGDELDLMQRWHGQTGCPPPDLLVPAQEGLLPEPLTGAVRAHLASCALCSELAATLAATDVVASDDEVGRMQQRVRFQTRGRSRTWLIPMAAAAAIVTVAGVAYLARLSNRPQAPGAPQPTATAPVTRQPVLALSAPAILLPPESLTMRNENRSAYAAALEDALTPFAAADYREAAVRLERVSREHPRRPHAEFYLGVARLLNGSSAEAVPPLQASRELAPPGSPLSGEAAWYLAVSLERSGRREAVAGPLTELCGGAGPRKAQACEGLRLLTNR